MIEEQNYRHYMIEEQNYRHYMIEEEKNRSLMIKEEKNRRYYMAIYGAIWQFPDWAVQARMVEGHIPF